MNKIKEASNGRPAASRINLQNQRVVIPVKQRNSSDQKIILPSIVQKSKDSTSIIYNPNQEIRFDVNNTYLNTDTYTYEGKTGTYDVPGYYNIILSKGLGEGSVSTFTINGGCANGTVLVYEITESSISVNSIVMKDYNLVKAIAEDIQRLKSEGKVENTAIYVPYILNMQHSDIERVEELNLDNKKISNVSGLETFINLKKLSIKPSDKIKKLLFKKKILLA